MHYFIKDVITLELDSACNSDIISDLETPKTLVNPGGFEASLI